MAVRFATLQFSIVTPLYMNLRRIIVRLKIENLKNLVRLSQNNLILMRHISGDTWEMSFGPCRMEQSCYFHAFIINDIVLTHIVKLNLLHLEVKGE